MGEWVNQFADSIVLIQSSVIQPDYAMPFKISGASQARGTGLMLNKRQILTCAHCIQNASQVHVIFPSKGQEKYNVRLLGACESFDLAMLELTDHDSPSTQRLSFADDTTVTSGEDTIALGYPLGQDHLKATRGILSGQQNNLLQTDTPINPGNSGGPLVRVSDKSVIGINSSGVDQSQNIGFAIPIRAFLSIREALERPGHLILHPERFGFEYQSTTAAFSALCKGSGVYVNHTVRAYPCAKMRPADLLHQISYVKNGQQITHHLDRYGESNHKWMNQRMDIENIEFDAPLGTQITFTYSRLENGKEQTLSDSFTYETPSSRSISSIFLPYTPIQYMVFGGIVVQPLCKSHVKLLKMTQLDVRLCSYLQPDQQHIPKLFVSAVLHGSLAHREGLVKKHDVIKRVNHVSVVTLDEYRTALFVPLKKNQKPYLCVEMESGRILFMPWKDALDQEQFLSTTYEYTPSMPTQQSKEYSQTRASPVKKHASPVKKHASPVKKHVSPVKKRLPRSVSPSSL